MATIAVVGASGYVGGRLIPRLLEAGHRVRALTRSAQKLRDYPWVSEVEVVEADLLAPETLDEALADVEAVYYLAHSMEAGDRFAAIEHEAASNMAGAAERAGVQRLIYLGGLGEGELSEHLRSRQESGRILASGAVPVVELRAAVIIGSGSLSFEMLRYLTEVLPVMTTPTWVRTRCQPIAIRNVLEALVAALDIRAEGHRIIDIGGPDVLTYEQMMQTYAELAGLRPRLIIRVPVLSPGLSSRWVGVVTPLTNDVAKHLVESLRNEVVVRDPGPLESELGLKPMSFREAVERALGRIAELNVQTRWSASGWDAADPLPSDPDYAFGTMLKDRRHVTTNAPPSDLFWAFCRVGGEVGYYRFNWAWSIRGWLDSLLGGAGLRRGRRHPEEVRVGESLDFWRVQEVNRDKRLLLHAEMKLPGEAWLEWSIQNGEGSSLTQTAFFAPRGLWGRIYWYAVAPFHVFIFPKMARAIVEAAEARQ